MKTTEKTIRRMSASAATASTQAHHLRGQNLRERNKAVIEEFNKHDARYIPITVIWREFIYPKFFISRQTLYRILNAEFGEDTLANWQILTIFVA